MWLVCWDLPYKFDDYFTFHFLATVFVQRRQLLAYEIKQDEWVGPKA